MTNLEEAISDAINALKTDKVLDVEIKKFGDSSPNTLSEYSSIQTFSGKSWFSMNTLYYYLSIFKFGSKHPQYFTARNFLRKVYGRSFIDTTDIIKTEEDLQSMIEFYHKLWAEDYTQDKESHIYFDNMQLYAEYMKEHPEEFGPSLKLSDAAKAYFKEDQLCIIDSLPELPEPVVTTAVASDPNEPEIIGNNREARRKRSIKKNRYKTKHNWRLKKYV